MSDDIRIPCHGGELAASLYRPTGVLGPVPCIVLTHGLSATREDGLGRFAERFAEAGCGALAIDFRHLGDSSGEPRGLVDVRRQYEDIDAAIDYARNLDGIDPARLAIWGTSFSGGHAVAAAARHNLAAAVAMVPFMDGLYEAMRMPLRRRLPLTVAAVRDLARRGGPPLYIRVGGPSGTFGVIAEDEAWAGWNATVGENSRWRNEIPARFSLTLLRHRPGRSARAVRCPLLVQIAEQETVIHNRPALRAARRAPRCELRSYPGLRHFDGYTGAGFERIVTDQIEFLHRHLALD